MVVATMSSPKKPAALFSSVLCPVDFSEHSRVALRYAALVADRSSARLTVLFVNDPMLVAAAAAAYDKRVLTAQSRTELERFVEGTLGAGRQRDVDTVVRVGEPASEIIKSARKLRADIIVVGSEGLSGARKVFFGSTTAQLLSETAVPVLAVPPDDSGSPSDRWPGPRVMAAIDLSRSAARDVGAAATIGRWFGARLILVHIVEKTTVPRWLSLKAGPIDRERVAKARARLERLGQAALPEGPPDIHVLAGDAADQISTLASDVGAGLVILTLRGNNRLLGDRKGATTYQVMREAGVPVLAVPDGYL
jgi:nucleotide-binding universal stress UspA family protein